jgi:glycosyltransferase involved in cell wall biosynthesis
MADVFCRPSINEGFGISFIESMACKIPTIGTNVGGITDIIKDGENGILVPPENVGELTNVLKRVVEDENLANRIAEEGYRTVRERFTWEVVLKEMDKVYQRLA